MLKDLKAIVRLLSEIKEMLAGKNEMSETKFSFRSFQKSF